MFLSKNEFNEEEIQGRSVDIEAVAESQGIELNTSPDENTTDLGEDFDEEPEGQLTIDVYQTPKEIVVESAVAGVNPDDLDINVNNDSVTIKGKRKRENEVKDEDYFYQECYWGKFSRTVILPQEIDPDRSYATLKNGILSVHLPKASKQKSKKIKVKLE